MGLFSSTKKDIFPWEEVVSIEQFNNIVKSSEEKPVLVFKHSIRCSISVAALSRFEKQMNPEKARCFYLDLLNHRDVSNEIASLTGIEHQSPQVIVWRNMEPIYNASHNGILADELLNAIG